MLILFLGVLIPFFFYLNINYYFCCNPNFYFRLKDNISFLHANDYLCLGANECSYLIAYFSLSGNFSVLARLIIFSTYFAFFIFLYLNTKFCFSLNANFYFIFIIIFYPCSLLFLSERYFRFLSESNYYFCFWDIFLFFLYRKIISVFLFKYFCLFQFERVFF